MVQIQRLAMEANQMTKVVEEGEKDFLKRKESHDLFITSLRSKPFGPTGEDAKRAAKVNNLNKLC